MRRVILVQQSVGQSIVNFNTDELRQLIEGLYLKLKSAARNDGVFMQLKVFWGHDAHHGREGIFCYSDEDGYHCGANDRGILVEDATTQDLVEIVYLALSTNISSMASKYELHHRIKGKDSRRLMFQKDLEYWGLLGEEYQRFAEQKIQEILKDYPFNDSLPW